MPPPDVRTTKKLMTLSHQQVSGKVIENWLNETLSDAEHLNIPLCILNPREQQPLTRYNIDPMTLAEAGIREEAAERIYKSLFVYSVGFFELLKQQMRNISDVDYIRIQKSLWLVYAVLLEYACKTDYQLLISKITHSHEQDLAKVARSFQEQAREEFEHR